VSAYIQIQLCKDAACTPPMNQNDFRKILATPRTVSGAKAPPLFTPSRTARGSSSNPFAKPGKPPARIRREGRSDVLEHSHVDLGSGFVDRAKERRLAELRGEQEDNKEVKGLDFDLLKKVRSGEFVIPAYVPPPSEPDEDESGEEDEEEKVEDMDEDAVLDELLKMEEEMKMEEEKAEKETEKKTEEVEETPVEEEPEPEQPIQPMANSGTEEVAKTRFKPIVDAKQLKQMRKEQKRRKLAMQAMDRVAKPASMAPPPPPKKTRAELLEQLRRIQAAKNTSEAPAAAKPSPLVNPIPEKAIMPPPPPKKPTVPVTEIGPPELESTVETLSTSPARQVSPPPRLPSPPPVKVGENMFSDESDLSDYNPYGEDNSDEDEPHAKPEETQAPAPEAKRNYFGDKESKREVQPSAPITLDPTIAAALRKAKALAEKHDIPAEVMEKKKPKGMSLGGMDGVYEFDEGIDAWDGEDEEEVGPKRKKRKEK
jgi:hypothetical protein